MIYVLIVVSYFAGTHNGQYVAFQEFNDYDSCMYALKVVEERKHSRYSHDNYKATCVPKGKQ